MADDEVFNKDFEFGRKAGDPGKFGLQHFQFDDHVAKQLAACGVREGAVVSEFVNLADVVQESTGEKQITIDLGIVLAHEVAGAAERDHVIEKSTNVGVVQGLGGWGVAVGLGNLRVSHEGFHQRFEMGIPKGSDEGRQGLPQLTDILGGLGQVIGEVDLRVAQAAQLVNGDLEAVLIFVEQAFDLEEVVLLEGVDRVLDVVPHLGFDLAGAITQDQRQIGLSGLLRLDLLGDDHKTRGDDLVFVVRAIGQEEFLHAVQAKLNLKQAQFFLLFEFLGVRIFGRGFYGLSLVGAGASVLVAGIDVNKCILAQFGEILPQRGLQFLHVERVLDSRLDFAKGWNSGAVVLDNLNDDEALPGSDHVRYVTDLHGEGRVLDLLG